MPCRIVQGSFEAHPGGDLVGPTRAFYAKCCYEEEARIRDYWAEGDDLVVFRKALDAY